MVRRRRWLRSLRDNGDGVVLARAANDSRVLDPMTGQRRRTITYPSWRPGLLICARSQDDRPEPAPTPRSITIYDAVDRRAAAHDSRSRSGTWIADMLMFDGGTCSRRWMTARRATGARCSDRARRMRVALWGPDDTTPRSTAEVSTSAPTAARCRRAAPCRPTIGRSCSRTRRGLGQGIACRPSHGTQRHAPGRASRRRSWAARSARTARSSRRAATTARRALWDAKTGALVDTFMGHDGQRLAADVLQADGQLTLHTASLDGTMITWDVSGSRRLGEPFHAGAGTDGAGRSRRGRAAGRGQPGRTPARHE